MSADTDPIIVPRCRRIFSSGHMSLERGVWANVCVLQSEARTGEPLDVQIEFGGGVSVCTHLTAANARKWGQAMVDAANALDADAAKGDAP